MLHRLTPPAKLGKRPIRVVALASDFCVLRYRSLCSVYFPSPLNKEGKTECFVYDLSPSKVLSDLVLTHTPLSSHGHPLFFPETKTLINIGQIKSDKNI